MTPEVELGGTDDPTALVRGDAAAIATTVARLDDLAAGCAGTAAGLRAVAVDGWTGPAAAAFGARLVEAQARWSRAADALDTAARAWDRFRTALVGAQDQAAVAVARFADGTAASAAARAAFAVAAADRRARIVAGGDPGPPLTYDDVGAAECAAARRLLADARARRTAAAADAARAVGAVTATAPDPPTGWDRRLAEATDWLDAGTGELVSVAAGVGEGVESLVRFVRTVDPADSFNRTHPGRFVENAATALADATGPLGRPLRLVASFVGPGWGTDPARAFGRLLPRALVGAVSGGVQSPRPRLWADPRPTARPFSPPPPVAVAPSVEGSVGGSVGDALAAADRRAADAFAAIGRAPARGLPATTALREPSTAGLPKLDPTKPAAPATTARPPRAAPSPAETWKAEERSPPRRDDPRPRHVDHDSGRARRARLTRADKDFASTVNRAGNRKSHLDAHGDLVPANPAGLASVVEHVIGRRSRAKIDSPYSSFTGPSARAEVDFGGFVIEVDVVRLQADIEAGLVTDVEVLAPHRVQAAIQADADRIAGGPVDLYVRRGRIDAAARSYGLGPVPTALLRQRMIDMANAQRHHEWMIRGVVPGRYILGPRSKAG